MYGTCRRDRRQGARLNFAENLLRRADDGTAIIFRGEDKAAGELTRAQLQMLVSRLQRAMKASK